MKLVFALLADAANTTETGKLNLLGVFQNINTTAVPTQWGRMFLAGSLRAEIPDKGQTKQIRVRLLDPDMKQINETTPIIATIPTDVPVAEPELSFIIQLDNTTFTQFGEHTLQIIVDGDILDGECKVQILPIVQPAPE